MKKKEWITIGCFGLLMMGLGTNDALRGIFAPVFQQRYNLSESQLSQLLTVSYLGNLLFLSAGGKLLDRFGKSTVMTSMIIVWGGSMLLNIVTDHYAMILISAFLALGASTLLNTSIGLATPSINKQYAGFLINVFFFLQGVGTSASQFLLGRYAFSYSGWRMISALLTATAILCLIMLNLSSLQKGYAGSRIQNDTDTNQEKQQHMPSAKIFWIFACMMGCYFIAEHSMMNRLMSYCINEFGMQSAQSSMLLSIFWSGMTVGRLMFAPVVQHLGCTKSIFVFGGVSVALFSIGCISGKPGVYLLSLSGLTISIIYPTLILFLQQLYPKSCVAAKTGAIISLGTVADIVFNAGFGFVLTQWGYRIGFMILPCFFVAFFVLYKILTNARKKEK